MYVAEQCTHVMYMEAAHDVVVRAMITYAVVCTYFIKLIISSNFV